MDPLLVQTIVRLQETPQEMFHRLTRVDQTVDGKGFVNIGLHLQNSGNEWMMLNSSRRRHLMTFTWWLELLMESCCE